MNPLSSSYAQRILVFGLTLSTCIYIAEIPLFNLLLPEIANDINDVDKRIISTSYGFAVSVSVLAGGWLGDRFGLRPIVLLGILAFAVGSFICTMPSVEALVLGRLIQGTGGGLFSPLVPAALVKLSPNRPGRSLAIWNFVIGVFIAVTPLLAVPFVAAFSWKGALAVLGIFAVAALLIVFSSRVYLEDARPAAVEKDRRNGSTMLLPPLMAYVALNYGVALLFLFWAPVAIERMDLSSGIAASVLSAMWLFFGIVGFLIRRGIDTYHVVVYLAASPIVILFGWFFFTWVQPDILGGLPLVLSGAIVGAGLGLGNSPSTLLIMQHAPAKRTSLAFSLDVSFARAGSVIIIWLLGDIMDHGEIMVGVCMVCVLNLICAFPSLYWLTKSK